MKKRVLVAGMIVVMLFVSGLVGWAAPLQQAQSVISYPTDGETVAGQVEITGIATHPNMNFYQLRYAAGSEPTGDSQWVDFAIVEGQQVQNDVLGTWDTTQLPDGQYTLALAVWGFDDANSPYVFFVTHVAVNNAQPPASPTPEQPAEEPTLAPTATVGPTPTPVTIEQPATPTPRPTSTPPPEGAETTVTPAAGDEGISDMSLNLARLRDGFCTGGLITLLLLSVWGFYLLAKAGLRWYLRRRGEPLLQRGAEAGEGGAQS
jgi:hypothetical protein